MSDYSNNGWSELECNYFYNICIDVVSDFFVSLGFSSSKTSIGGVIFLRGDIFVELSYVPETMPLYAPSIIIGVGCRKFSENGLPQGFPIWYVLPEKSAARGYSNWRFSNESQLVNVLGKIHHEILLPYVKPIILDVNLLSGYVAAFSKSLKLN